MTKIDLNYTPEMRKSRRNATIATSLAGLGLVGLLAFEPAKNLLAEAYQNFQGRGSIMVLNDVMDDCYANASTSQHQTTNLGALASLGQIQSDLENRTWSYGSIDWDSLNDSRLPYCPEVERYYTTAGIVNGQPWTGQ